MMMRVRFAPAMLLFALSALGAPDGGHAPRQVGPQMPPPEVQREDERLMEMLVQPADIREAIRSAQAPIRQCYERELSDGGAPAVRTIEFTIAASGTASRSAVRCSPACPSLSRCIGRALGRLRFPPFDAGTVDVRFPVNELSEGRPQ
jgi:hypothetical protein